MGLLSLSSICNGGNPDFKTLRTFLGEAKEHFKTVKPFVELSGNVTVAGDTHGQVHDLRRALLESGVCPSVDEEPISPMVFLGDYIDRGPQSIQTAVAALYMACEHPDRVVALAGNHERPVFDYNRPTCLPGELRAAYPEDWEDLLQDFRDVFDELPIAAIANKDTFCVHGGPPQTTQLDSLVDLPKATFTDPAQLEAVCCLWSDPASPAQDAILKKEGIRAVFNTPRQAGLVYGEEYLRDFLEANGLRHLVRGHQLLSLDGPVDHWGLGTTVFTASNYGASGNAGSTVTVGGNAHKHTVWRPEE